MMSSSSILHKEVNVMEKFTRVTIRVPEIILDKLKTEAENKKLSFNSYLSKLLYKNVVSDLELKAIPSINIGQSLFTNLVSFSNEKQLSKLATEEVETIKKLFKILGYEYTIKNVIKKYFTIMGEQWNWYQFNYFEESNKCRLIFQTNLGKNWLRFLTLIVLMVMESMKIPVSDEYVKNDTLVVEFSKLS